MQHDQPLKTNGIMSLTGKLEDHHVKQISQIQRERERNITFLLLGGVDQRGKLFGVPKRKEGQGRVR